MSLLKEQGLETCGCKILGGVKMKYQKPKIELIVLEAEDIVRTSLTDGGYGDNDEQVGGDGTKPWE